MVMFGAIVTAAFIWTLMPGETERGGCFRRQRSGQGRSEKKSSTTQKTSRLPMSDVDRACEGQNWGGAPVASMHNDDRPRGWQG